MPPSDTQLSDERAFIAMLDRAGIVYSIESNAQSTNIEIEAKKGPANVGYQGFATQFTFDSDGKLQQVGTWE